MRTRALTAVPHRALQTLVNVQAGVAKRSGGALLPATYTPLPARPALRARFPHSEPAVATRCQQVQHTLAARMEQLGVPGDAARMEAEQYRDVVASLRAEVAEMDEVCAHSCVTARLSAPHAPDGRRCRRASA